MPARHVYRPERHLGWLRRIILKYDWRRAGALAELFALTRERGPLRREKE